MLQYFLIVFSFAIWTAFFTVFGISFVGVILFLRVSIHSCGLTVYDVTCMTGAPAADAFLSVEFPGPAKASIIQGSG